MYQKKNSLLLRILLGIGIVIIVTGAFFPFFWVIITSFKLPKDALTPTWIPFLQFKPTLSNWYGELVERGRELSIGLKNSLIISITTTVLSLLIGSLAGYAIARYEFKYYGRKNLIVFFLSLRMLPPVALVVPFLLMMKAYRMVDTQLSLIIANTTFNLPFAALILYGTFREIPKAVEESAMIDGCSTAQIFLHVALPLAISGIIAAGILCFVFTWNEYMFALTLAYRRAVPITVQIVGTKNTQGIQFWITSVRGLVAVIPPIIIALLAQRFLVKGLTFGAMKG